MAVNNTNDVVGVDPEGAARLAGLLEDAEASLGARAARVQALLDEAGVTSTVPGEIRSVGRSCGAEAADLGRRAGMIRMPAPLSEGPTPGVLSPGWGVFSGPGSSTGPNPCAPPPAPDQPVGGMNTWTVPGLAGPLSGVRTGPWVTPIAPGRTGPWLQPGLQTGGVTASLAGTIGNTMTVAGPRCTTVYSTPGSGWRPGQRVQPPAALPAFPGAARDRPKTPVQGGGGLRTRWTGPDGRIYEWDGQHGKVEVYDRRGRHRGEFDPDTGAQTKPAKPGRKVEP